jgi:hypothetical protein
MLTQEQRERILHHLDHGWKLPDSLVQELWAAYETLEQIQSRGATLDGQGELTKTPQGGQGEIQPLAGKGRASVSAYR